LAYVPLIALISVWLAACGIGIASPPLVTQSAPSSDQPASTTTSVPATITLNADGISSLPFGTAEQDVLNLMTAPLGTPTLNSAMGECEAAGGSWQEYAKFGDVTVRFGANDDSPNSPRFLASWTYRSTNPPTPPLALDPSIPFGLTLDQLQAQYPDGPNMDNMGAWYAGGVWIIPGVSDFPDTVVTGGDIDWCT